MTQHDDVVGIFKVSFFQFFPAFGNHEQTLRESRCPRVGLYRCREVLVQIESDREPVFAAARVHGFCHVQIMRV